MLQARRACIGKQCQRRVTGYDDVHGHGPPGRLLSNPNWPSAGRVPVAQQPSARPEDCVILADQRADAP